MNAQRPGGMGGGAQGGPGGMAGAAGAVSQYWKRHIAGECCNGILG
jgi:hypothetical protein